ncbi:MAG TPA: ABC transporter permease [Gemmatimonadaceae bacterium]|nr:ABC transporter permease [Gemmatimonadaceae bacterium]
MRFSRESLSALRAQLTAHVLFGMRTAAEAVVHNKLRAGLTSLGILFGVASVIAMLAIGRGAKSEILAQMALLGSNNIVITPLDEQKEGEAKEEEEPGKKEVKRYTPGLNYRDVEAIQRMVPGVDVASAEIVVNTTITREGRRRSGKVVGVDTTYFRLTNEKLTDGSFFSPSQIEHGRPVAIIGYGVRTRFFTTAEPVGQQIKVGDSWLTVVGVLKDKRVSNETAQRLGIRDPNMDVYVPVRTMLLRYRDRAQLNQRDVQEAGRGGGEGFIIIGGQQQTEETEEQRAERTNLNQLDKIVVRVTESEKVPAVAELIQRMLQRRHNQVIDFEVTVPELLLQQEQRTRNIFNIVLGAIASISLIVGGIGIMNIMLASVLERTREIGVRRAMGATQKDILFQFLSEAVLISVAGGLAGIIVGASLSFGIERFADIKTLISYVSIVVAFGVSLTVGLVFGIVPAYRAARADPVVSLRYE